MEKWSDKQGSHGSLNCQLTFEELFVNIQMYIKQIMQYYEYTK